MTLANTLRTKLAEFSYDLHDPSGSSRDTLVYEGWKVVFRPETRGAVGCALQDVTLDRVSGQPVGDTRAWAERVSRKVTGLLEPLKVVEIDAGRQVALVRSAAPTPNEAGLDYQEIELHGTAHAVVRRYRGFREAGKNREQIPFAVTFEALAQLIGGITASPVA
jgi:hypothetical protein